MPVIRVNTRPLRTQLFRPCDPDFIRDVCHAACCRSTTDPTGIAVTVTPVEIAGVIARGATVDYTTGRVNPVDRRCPFQHPETHLCNIHTTDDYPSGCLMSPFTINTNLTLIVRNRYRLLKCFKAADAVPVAIAHRASLERIFGAAATAVIIHHVTTGNDTTLHLDADPADIANLLHKNHASKGTPT